MIEMIKSEINSHILTAQKTLLELQRYIYTACVIATDTITKGNKILIFGNGGSAADAQHIAAELVGRYKTQRKGLSAIALTTDTSALTAIGNDFGYESVFERQVEALARKGDLLIGISTSGTSLNVVRALKLGRDTGCRCIGLSGKEGGVMSEVCDINIIVPSSDTPRIQEIHIMIGHIICQAIDNINS
ncbi:MAG: D-sedoheptulose 7-phosphate isomerase [Campylobacteraceae bacterium]|jgi:D-sedoheptulose 7-phosphate isomerase|nr:D-sedoheptulose 7-phosphate isomerase [Campylobacteraceae bacterium]